MSQFTLPGVDQKVMDELAVKTVEVAKGLFENKLVT